ncbi:hypothetical protein [Apis mellifera associated microvirus 51]|nr:hypothetical protein [Apis mellifera associated microvirus 51]
MSRRRSSRQRRDSTHIANQRLPLSPLENLFRVTKPPLVVFEDRRQWHPEGKYAPARSFSSSRHRLREVPGISRGNSRNDRSRRSSGFRLHDPGPLKIGFGNPSRVLVCVRRRIRKEVLFARRKTGRVGQRRPRFNFYSQISCRR